ncbi:TonB-dependent receptor [Shewanella sp. c952]|uniref:TonB-dependent receptor n=1 Tax=Shewanella sp. c952 TaxID=2815913 RepID=UPI001BC29830|nr:TonB-dependent receptor [Shewanella sp. c952]GIU18154.1 TonB-dependent receptor [Shewanella sp. c952]
MNMNKLAKFVGLACGSIVALSSPVYAAEQNEDDEVERIAVTGSRIKRVDMEGASPVTTITADDMIAAGFTTVGDALRASNLNSFGSYGGTANNSWSSQATIQLKGAGAGHTLILLDGKRMAKSPVLGGDAANINTIPSAAVERVEILSDGASAVYGTDAVAGVVNIILKKDFEGIEFKARVERPEADGGNSKNFSFSGGLNSEQGSLVFTMEHYQKSKVLMADRDYTAAMPSLGDDPQDYRSWRGLSQTGRTLDMGSNGGWAWLAPFTNNDLTCAEVYGERFVGPLTDSKYGGDTACAYDYTHAAALDVDRERTNTLINYTYNITDDIELTARAYWAANKTIDQSAPVPGTIYFNEAMPAYTTAEGLDLRETPVGASMKYRYDTSGNRHKENHDNMYDILIGLTGTTGEVDWDLSATYNRYNNFVWGTGYELARAASDLLGSVDPDTGVFEGWDPRDPKSAMPEGATANFDMRQTASYSEISGGASYEIFELPAGGVGMYLGASYREESLDSQADALSAAGKIKGASGGGGGIGERDIKAVFTELSLPILENLDLNLAARYDDYSDFGDTFNPQVSIRYNVIEQLLLRASWGTGFKAPSLAQLNQDPSEGWGDVTNYLSCYEAGELDSCGIEDNIPTYIGKNTELKPEESESYNVGAVWDITDNINMTVDYWKLSTDNLIDTMGEDALLLFLAKQWEAADAAGQPRAELGDLFPGTSVSRNSAGRLVSMQNRNINLGETEREGIDANVAATFETGIGEFKLGLAWSHYIKYTETSPEDGALVVSHNKAGKWDNPDDRISFTTNYFFAEDHNLYYKADYIDSQSTNFVEDNGSTFEIDSVIYHTLTYTYDMPWNNTISLGVNNLTDEEPAFDYNGGYEASLYDINGRSYWASFTQRF